MYVTNKVAILLATYNGEKYLREQIESLLEQTYKEWDLYVHDDGSTDTTVEILKLYESTYPDKIHIVEGIPTGGAKNNFFYLLKNVNAPYVMFCDQDDVWLDNKIAKTITEMKAIENSVNKNLPILVFSDLKVVDSNLKTLSNRMSDMQCLDMSKTLFKDLMIQNIVTGCTIMVNRSLIDMTNDITNTNCIIMHDWWLALIASYFGVIQYIPSSLIKYRQHEANSVGAKKIFSFTYILKKLRKFREIKISLLETQKQVESFAVKYDLFDDQLIRGYAMLSGMSKLSKIIFLVKYKVWKHGFIRNIALLMFV